MEGTADAPEHILQCIVILHMEKLMENHVVIQFCPLRHSQHRANHPADHRRGQSGKDHCLTRLQPIPLCHLLYLLR